MKMGCSYSPLQTHEDVVTEIALHLPVQSLLRHRAVCKLWRDVIDSPLFRKLHINHSNKEEEDEDEAVYLQLDYDSDFKVSIKVLDKWKSLDLNLIEFNGGFPSQEGFLRISTSMNGLICFNLSLWRSAERITIWNPFLGQIRVLPSSPILSSPNPSCRIDDGPGEFYKVVGIGCDGEFYKVVEVAFCWRHYRLHAHLYSRRLDSWRELDSPDQNMVTVRPIELPCNDGHFAHWYARDLSVGDVILTFDMKNEVFRTTKLPKWNSLWWVKPDDRHAIVAKEHGDSFVLIILPRRGERWVRIFESSISICEEEEKEEEEEEEEEGPTRKLSWNFVVNLEQPVVQTIPTTLPLWRRDCVMINNFCRIDSGVLMTHSNSEEKRLLYDCRARRFIGYFNLPHFSEIFCYKGTFISP